MCSAAGIVLVFDPLLLPCIDLWRFRVGGWHGMGCEAGGGEACRGIFLSIQEPSVSASRLWSETTGCVWDL